jgi:hypothetical protein
MVITIFPRDGGIYPEVHLGQKSRQLFIELDPTGSSVEQGVKKRDAAAVLTSKKVELPVAETVAYPYRPGFTRAGTGPHSAMSTTRFKIPEPGTYTIRLFANDQLTLTVKPQKAHHLASDIPYYVTLEAKHIIRDSFVGKVSLNGVRLDFGEEGPSERRTVWEHLIND